MPADESTILAEISEMLRAIRDDIDDDDVTMDAAFRGDLGIESIDVVALAGRLQARYGNTVNFAQFVAELDPRSVGELTVRRLVEFIAAARGGAAAAPGPRAVPVPAAGS
jgi:acyl carrier protein